MIIRLGGKRQNQTQMPDIYFYTLVITANISGSYCPIPAVVSVNFTSSTYPVNEGDGAVQVCVSLYDIPSGGLGCELEVTLGSTNGVKAGVYGSFEWCFMYA